ncbi:MAG: TonB-dependent receptor [Candidatus Margulisbacteria bacterium]|nr:TonB-dependent receptor [Candidatus Margulisiibacteriota bacterium]
MFNKLIGFFCLLLIASCSYAIDVPRFYGQEVVVTASRLPQLKSQSPWDTTVIGSAELQSFKTVGEALRTVAGSDVISYGSLGSLTSVRLRGANSSQVLVLLDGRRINSPTLGMFDVGDLLLDNVEKIEVVRAPLSAVYGSDAISGVVNIITKSPAKARKIFTALTGSFGTQQYKVELNSERFLLSAGQLKSDGFRTNGDYLSNNVYAKVVQPTPIGHLFADYSFYDAKKGVPGVPTSEADPASASEPNDRQTDRNSFASAGLKNDNFQLRAYQNILNQKLSPYIFGASTNEAQQTGLEWSQNFELPIGKILYGLEGREDRGKTTMSGDHAINNYAAFVQDEFQAGERSTITASLRGDKHSTAGTSINPRAGVVYQAADNLLLRASAGTAFRAPTLNELYWNDVNWNMFGDVNLKPEKSTAYEFGLERRLSDKTTARINYFTSTVTDLILWVYNPTTFVTQVKNIGEVKSEGVEVELERSIGKEGKGFINYTYQKVIDKKDANPAAVDKTIPYTPVNKYTVGLVSGGASLLIKSVGERYADQANTLRLAAYTVVDFKLSRQVSDMINVELAANNLFDEKYAEVVGYDPTTFAPRNYPMPGRNYSIGVKLEL